MRRLSTSNSETAYTGRESPVAPRTSRARWLARLILPLFLPLAALVVFDQFVIARDVKLGGTDATMKAYRQNPANLVLIGNSITRTAFDEDRIAARLAAAGHDWKVFKYHVHSTGPALWFLILKNVVLQATPKPEWVVIAGRDQVLLQPFDAFSLRYSRDRFATYLSEHEPEVDQKLFLQAPPATSLDELLHRYSHTYFHRKDCQRAVSQFVFELGMSVAERCGNQDAGGQAGIEALRRAFLSETGLAAELRSRYNEPRPDVDYFNVAQDDLLNHALEQAGAFANLRGMALIAHSFIPDIIALCRANGVRLMFVRHYVPAANRNDDRWRAMEQYVASHAPEVLTLDMHGCAGITSDEFYAGSHFRTTAQLKLSDYFVEHLVDILDAPRTARR
jgi:hypothetical protein